MSSDKFASFSTYSFNIVEAVWLVYEIFCSTALERESISRTSFYNYDIPKLFFQMSRHETDSRMSVDIAASPSTSMQCVENSSPIATSIKNLYSKLITSYQRSDHLSVALTPENKTAIDRIASPFINGRSLFNPFNQNLRERLENPIFSPHVFSTVISPSQVNLKIL